MERKCYKFNECENCLGGQGCSLPFASIDIEEVDQIETKNYKVIGKYNYAIASIDFVNGSIIRSSVTGSCWKMNKEGVYLYINSEFVRCAFLTLSHDEIVGMWEVLEESKDGDMLL